MPQEPTVSMKSYENAKHQAAHLRLQDIQLKLHRMSLVVILMSQRKQTKPTKDQFRVVSGHIMSATSTLHAMLALTSSLTMQVKEGLALARTFFETCLMASYCALDDGARAHRVGLYTIYRSIKSRVLHEKIGGIDIRLERPWRIDRNSPLAKEAEAVFGKTSKVRPCFQEDRGEIVQKVLKECPQAGILFLGVEKMAFDISSEIIHGSHYGSELFHRLQHMGASDEENYLAHYEMMHNVICLSIVGLCEALQLGFDRDRFSVLKEACLAAVDDFAA